MPSNRRCANNENAGDDSDPMYEAESEGHGEDVRGGAGGGGVGGVRTGANPAASVACSDGIMGAKTEDELMPTIEMGLQM